MKTKSGLFSCSRGFTLAELLTVMAIIAILIGLLVPTITIIQKTAQKVKQKSQFHGIEITLESFGTDFGDYPDSSYDGTGIDPGYCGAQKLAEAVVGWDGFGVHPQSGFRSDGMNDIVDTNGDNIPDYVLVYDIVNGILNGTYQTPADNRRVRKGPYLELEAANAVKLADLYPGAVGTLKLDTYVLVDMFGKVTHGTTRKRTGMPILYYKANVGGMRHIYSLGPIMNSNVYKVIDNDQIYTTQPPFGSTSHPLDADQSIFYDRTTNPNFPGSPFPPHLGRRPYRSESFILHSAGRDGLYGTADDVYNFDTE